MSPRSENDAGGLALPMAPTSPLAVKYSRFTAFLLAWVAFVVVAYDWSTGKFDPAKVAFIVAAVPLLALAIAHFTSKTLARPLATLRDGVDSVRQGRLEPIALDPSRDEIEDLGNCLNEMITALSDSRSEVQTHQELLEERIRRRTEALEVAMRKANEASRAKSMFLANMSHELRTPMTGILGTIDLVLESDLTADQRDEIEIIKSSAHTLLSMLNDMLDLSKIEAGKMLLEKTVFDLAAVTRECLRAFEGEARRKGIDIALAASPGLPMVTGDPLRVRQILNNLVSNAVKFTERGSVTVSVAVSQPAEGPGLVRISVKDTGIGIAPDKRERIFQEFAQADESTTRQYGGTGLGLTIVKKLAELHSGSVKLESELGTGSRFQVELRMEIAAPRAAESTHVETRATSVQRVLVVEDNAVNRKVISAILSKRGYHVEGAEHGRAAIEALEAGSFDLVLMDVQMPVLDGVSATRMIREREQWHSLPIIAMTAHAMNGDRERCLRAGMDEYMTKPITAEHLISVIRRTLDAASQGDTPAHRQQNRPQPDLQDGDTGLAAGMTNLFRQLAPDRLHRLRLAAVRLDTLAVQEQALKLARSADAIQAVAVVRLAEEIAESAPKEDFKMISGLIEELTNAVNMLRPANEESTDWLALR